MAQFPELFTAVKIGKHTLKNRFALAPMTRARAGPSLIPNDLMKDYYTQRATAGLVITEGTHVSPRARGWVDVPGIWTEEQTEGWKPIVKSVHEAGAVFFLQMWHQGRQSHSSFHNGEPPVSASDVPMEAEQHTADYKKAPAEKPRPLTKEEIKETVQEFVVAARNAIAAGFDGVEIHGANGYLLDQFHQSKTNKRTDEYGGSIENRFRFSAEVVDAVVAEVGADRVGFRISPNGFFGEMGDPEYRELFSHIISELGQRNIAYVHIMDGLGFGFHKLGEPFTLQEARELLKGSTTKIIGNCGYTAEEAAQRVRDGVADVTAFGRPYIANPDLPERIQNGHPLSDSDHKWWFSPNEEYSTPKGYTDFPTFAESQAQAVAAN